MLRAKIVKPDHGGHYKRMPLPCTGDNTITVTRTSKENHEIENKHGGKKGKIKKEIKKGRKEKIES